MNKSRLVDIWCTMNIAICRTHLRCVCVLVFYMHSFVSSLPHQLRLRLQYRHLIRLGLATLFSWERSEKHTCDVHKLFVQKSYMFYRSKLCTLMCRVVTSLCSIRRIWESTNMCTLSLWTTYKHACHLHKCKCTT